VKTTRTRLALGAAASLLALQGCAVPGSPDYDAKFGSAWRTMQGQQVADPAATTRNANARETMDGRAVREARERYVESFSSPPPSNVTNINVGSGSGSGSGR
jgi:hypothetical protein